jgi:hypothetical protein
MGLVVAAVAWVPVDEPVEGPTFVELTETHGVTATDMLSVGLVAVAAWLWLGD